MQRHKYHTRTQNREEKLPVRVNKCGFKSKNYKVTTINMFKEVKYLKKYRTPLVV